MGEVADDLYIYDPFAERADEGAALVTACVSILNPSRRITFSYFYAFFDSVLYVTRTVNCNVSVAVALRILRACQFWSVSPITLHCAMFTRSERSRLPLIPLTTSVCDWGAHVDRVPCVLRSALLCRFYGIHAMSIQ